MPTSRTVFNHDTALSYPHVTRARVKFPSGRALVGSRPGDVVQISPELEPELPAIADHYARLGIECAEEIVFSLDLDVVCRYPDARWSTYIFSEWHHLLRPDAARLAATARFDQKNEFIAWCRANGFPTPATEQFRHGELPRVNGFEMPMFVKASWSLGGYDVFKCHNIDELQVAVARIEGDYQIQETVQAVAWLNVMYEIAGGAAHVATTEQQLNGALWQGARFPSSHDPRSVSDPIADALAEAGLVGLLGIDVAMIAASSGEVRCVAIEANPRTNASTYFQWTADRINAQHWVGCNVATRHRTLAPLLDNVDDLVFDSSRQSGVVVTNWGPVLGGRVGMLFVGSESEQQELRAEVTARLA